MRDDEFDVVTGAFSYSGAAIARELQATGRRVRTLTGHPGRAPKTSSIAAMPLDFDHPTALADSMRGATTLYNTYWIRFSRGNVDHTAAVANSRTLFHAARLAGVRRIVHLSITNPSTDSPYAYFRGKAEVEDALAEVGVPFTVLRPAILFGGDGVLINNIAWLLRRLPVFAVGGTGDYRIRGIHIDDLARLCVEAGSSSGDAIIDAVGPDRPTFRELLDTIKTVIGSSAVIVGIPGTLIPAVSSLVGLVVRDRLLTADEYRAMADGLADTDGPATGHISIIQWLADNHETLGIRYANEIDRHFR